MHILEPAKKCLIRLSRLLQELQEGAVNYGWTILPPSKDTKTENLSLSISLQNPAC
ncbi:hypothetical protein V1L52_03310 [Treponema sp. HNW]|uniref:hypothetical protein n=1 Tax=Treponema sp. HNW TaxID=3116654 RepID=UPI003D13E35B